MTGATLPPSAQLLGVFSRPVLCSHIGEKKKKKGKKKGGGGKEKEKEHAGTSGVSESHSQCYDTP